MLQQINTENFQQMLAQFSTTELESMIVKFPYFEQAHVLLAKKYQQENSPKFDQQLQLAALYIQDRGLLYTLFKDNTIAESVVAPVNEVIIQQEQKENVIQQAVIEPEIVTETKQEPVEIAEQKQTAERIETTPVFNDEALAAALEELKQSAEALQQISEEAKSEEAVQTIQSVTNPVETEIKENIEVENISIEEKPTFTSSAQQVEKKKEEETPQNIKAIEEIQGATEETIEQHEPVAESFSRIAPHTFDEWLQAFNNKSVKKTAEIPAKDEVLAPDEELNQLYTSNITVDYLHGLVKDETNYSKGLERFIEEQIQKHKHPEINKKTTENEPDTGLVTETMAKVYEMQKKYVLAIKAYEALTLKFPEKSSLFAARINFLKNTL